MTIFCNIRLTNCTIDKTRVRLTSLCKHLLCSSNSRYVQLTSWTWHNTMLLICIYLILMAQSYFSWIIQSYIDAYILWLGNCTFNIPIGQFFEIWQFQMSMNIIMCHHDLNRIGTLFWFFTRTFIIDLYLCVQSLFIVGDDLCVSSVVGYAKWHSHGWCYLMGWRVSKLWAMHD